MKLRPVEQTTAYEAVRDQLLAQIEEGAVEVGEKLPGENELARALGVSRPVLREALGSLRAMGIVRSEPGRGTYVVSKASQPPVLLSGRYAPTHLHEVRMLLETAAASSAATRGSDEQLRDLKAVMVAFDSSSDVAEFASYDMAFHLAVARASGNPVLELALRQLQEMIREEIAYLARSTEWPQQAIADHSRIYEAISSRNASAAERLMRAHLQKIHHQFLGRIAVGFSQPSHSAMLRPQAKIQDRLEDHFAPRQHPVSSEETEPSSSTSAQKPLKGNALSQNAIAGRSTAREVER